MLASEAEILAQIHKVQAELFLALPAELRMTAEDVTALQIRVQLLRARLDFSPEQEEVPLPLLQMLALLVELAGHAEELSLQISARGLDGTASLPAPSLEARDTLLAGIRGALLHGEIVSLRQILEQQRLALVSAPAPLAPPPTPDSGPENLAA